ncbi:hypothetical protein OC861_004501 [Tilletia horrida]|nr:hypothetical protein OC861_004501 [Tilletia horrida]
MAGTGGGQPVELHSRCEIARLGEGEVVFVGQTSFAPGLWVGVVLDEANGKNNGVVQGKRYFECSDGHGVFVRPSQVHHVETSFMEPPASPSPPPPPAPARVTPAAAAATPRNAASASRVSRSSIASSVASSRPTSGLATPASRVQSPDKRPLGSTTSIYGRVQSPVKPGGLQSRPSIGIGSTAAAATTTPRPRPTGSLGPGSRRLTLSSATSSGVSTPSPADRLQRLAGSSRPGAAPGVGAGRTTTTSAFSTPRPTASSATPAARSGVRPTHAPRPSVSNVAPPTGGLSRTKVSEARREPERTPATASSAQRAVKRPDGKERTVDQLQERLKELQTSVKEESLLDGEPELEQLYDEGANVQESESLISQSPPPANLAQPESAPAPPAMSQMAMAATAERVRELERKREEDREAILAAERKVEEAMGKEKAIEKLQERLKEMQATLKDQGKLERELEQLRNDYERQIVDLNEQLEMAMLDKEVAEEKYEVLVHDFDALKEEKEEMQIDRDLAREELAMFEQGEVPEADRASAEFIKLERQNMRLQEALLRVRDVSNEVEADLKYKVTELDKELASMSGLQAKYEEAIDRNEALESANEDLRAQLDAALGAEEMLETLTERNLSLNEKYEAARLEIEELDEMNQVYKDIEQAYEENFRTLQEEIYFHESATHQLAARVEALSTEVVEQDAYIQQYRELVQNLNAEVDTLRAERDADDATLAGEDGTTGPRARAVAQSQALLDKDFQITRSASKTQAKTIDMELGKLRESQAVLWNDMVRPYLPPIYYEGDAEAVNALLFFRRMSQKADIIKAVLEFSHDIQDSLNGTIPEHLVEVCTLRNSLVHFAAVARRITSVLNLASPEDFLRAGQQWRTFLQTEKRLDVFLDALRVQELKEPETERELRGHTEEFESFAAKFTSTDNAELAALEVGVASLFEHDLDTLAAAFGFAKQRIAALYEDEEVEWQLGSRSLEADIFEPLQQLINNVRATRVPARKLTRRLQTLFISEEAVKQEATGSLSTLSASSSALVGFARSLASSFNTYAAEVRTSKTPFLMSNIVSFVDEATNEAFKKSDQTMWTSPIAMTLELMQTINQILANALEQENIIKVTGTKPWLLRVDQIRAEMTHNADAERHISSQSEEIIHLRRSIKQRDQILQEHAVKIERLQIHLNRSKDQVDQMTDLRKQLEEARKQAKDYQEANDQLQSDLDRAEQEKTTLVQQQQQQQTAAAQASSSQQKSVQQSGGELGLDAIPPGGAGAPSIGGTDYNMAAIAGASGMLGHPNLETSFLVDQLDALRGAIRYLRTENACLRSTELMRDWSTLPPLASGSGRRPLGDITNASERATLDVSTEGEPDVHGEPAQKHPGGEELRSERLRKLAAESRQLHLQALKLVTSPRIVDLSVLVSRSEGGPEANRPPSDGTEPSTTNAEATPSDKSEQKSRVATIHRPIWQPSARLPLNQYRASRDTAKKLRAQVQMLSTRVRGGLGEADAASSKPGRIWTMPSSPHIAVS